MKSKVLLISALCGTLTWALPALPQKEPVKADTARFGNPTGTGRGYQNYLYGVIKSVNAKEIVLAKTKFGVDQIFKVEAKTKFINNRKRASWDKLKVGDQVFVDFRRDKKTGDLIAKKVVTGAEVVSTP